MTEPLPRNGTLVRDRIPDIIRADGREPDLVRLTHGQRRAALLAKLHEEADELATATTADEVIGELADVYEVLRALAEQVGHSWQEIEHGARRKSADRGGFAEGWWLAGMSERAWEPLRRPSPDRDASTDTGRNRRADPGMRFVGVDLAWGPNGTTGLAVLDAAGDVLDVTHARTDEEIGAWMAIWAPSACLVAIDAPIIVRNPTGRRACETLVGRYFGAFDAHCHSSNTANPNFADGGRAMRLAGALGLDVDPASAAERRAIEVYPHPALVALFDLPRILRYKHKRGRDVPSLRAEMLRLLDLVESLADAHVPLRVRANADWLRIRSAVTQATRKVDLGRVEDSVDAVVCAYIATYHHAEPARTRVLGTYADGYIVTPVPPGMAELIDADQ